MLILEAIYPHSFNTYFFFILRIFQLFSNSPNNLLLIISRRWQELFCQCSATVLQSINKHCVGGNAHTFITTEFAEVLMKFFVLFFGSICILGVTDIYNIDKTIWPASEASTDSSSSFSKFIETVCHDNPPHHYTNPFERTSDVRS